MNEQQFKRQLQQLDDAVWQQLFDGGGLAIEDDLTLLPAAADAANTIVQGTGWDAGSPAQLKQLVNERAGDLLAEYYRTHPLSQSGFNRQLRELAKQHGMQAFIAVTGQQPAMTVFVDSGELVAEPAGSARHPYGVYLQLDRQADDSQLEAAFDKWLESGAAWQDYLNMNVCRYNC